VINQISGDRQSVEDIARAMGIDVTHEEIEWIKERQREYDRTRGTYE